MTEGAASPPEAKHRPRLAALLSFAWPGLGQAYEGRRRRAVVQSVPPALVVLGVLASVLAVGPLMFGLHLLNPPVSLGLLIAIVVLGVWRAASIADVALPRTRSNTVVVTLLVALVVLSHGWLALSAWSFYRAGQQIHEPPSVAAAATPTPVSTATPGADGQSASPSPTGPIPADGVPTPVATEAPLPGTSSRVTILLVGIDNTHQGDWALTDSLIVASFDPTAGSLTMVSVPRDTARVPLYSGGDYQSRINTLMQSAARHPESYPDGPMGTLMNEMSYLVGIPIDYYARINISGFTQLIDAVGGVDVVVERPIDDPFFQFSPTEVGFHLDVGQHHLDGKLATAYARSRHGVDNSDYQRARRQQQIMLALRARLGDPAVLANLPSIVTAASDVIRTDAPLDHIPDIVSIALASNSAATRQIVLSPPNYASHPGGSVATVLDMDAVAKLSVELFGDESRYAGGSTN